MQAAQETLSDPTTQKLRHRDWEPWEVHSLRHLYIDLDLTVDDMAVLLKRSTWDIRDIIAVYQKYGTLREKDHPAGDNSIWHVRVEAILDYNRRRGCDWEVICALPGSGRRTAGRCATVYAERAYLSRWSPEDDRYFVNLAWKDFERAWGFRLRHTLGRKYTKYDCERRLILLRSDPVSEDNIAAAPEMWSVMPRALPEVPKKPRRGRGRRGLTIVKEEDESESKIIQ